MRVFPRRAAAFGVLIGLSLILSISCGRGKTSRSESERGRTAAAGASESAPAAGGPGAPAPAEGSATAPPRAPGAPAAAPAAPGQPQAQGQGQGQKPPQPITVGEKVVVARINGKEIIGKDLNRAYISSWRQFVQSGQILPEDQQKKLMGQLLDAMIGNELLLQQAVSEGIKPDQKAIDELYHKIQSGASSEQQFQQALQQMGITAERLREQLTNNYVTDSYVKKFAASHAKQIATTEAEAKAFYDKNPEAFTHQEMVHARHILRKFPPNVTDEQKKAERAKIEEALAKLKKGEDFAQVARTYSSDNTAAKGGDLGYFPRGRMVPQFEEAAFSLKPGQISGIVESRFGYHLIRCEDKVAAGVVPFANVKKQILDKLSEDKKQKELNAEIDKLRAKAKVEVLLKFPEKEEKTSASQPKTGEPASSTG